MNRRARQLGLTRHPLREPDRARPRRQLLERPGPRQAHAHPAPQPRSSARRDEPPRATLRSGARPRTLVNRNTARRPLGPGVNGVKTGHTQQAGYVLVGSATQRRRHGRRASCWASRARPPATPTRSRSCATAWRATAGSRVVRAGRPVATAPVADGRRRGRARAPTRTVVRTVRRGEPVRDAGRRRARRAATARCRRGARVGTVERALARPGRRPRAARDRRGAAGARRCSTAPAQAAWRTRRRSWPRPRSRSVA